MDNTELIDWVLKQITEDVGMGDLQAIELLLKQVPKEALESFLPEEELSAFLGKYKHRGERDGV